MNDSERRVIIACGVFKPELEALRPDDETVEVRYLDQSLHRTPEMMPELIKEQIDQVASYATRIVLGYGLCSNGVVGVTAPRQGLYIPRVHDCISLFLGSARAYQERMDEEAGVYYLTPGWVAEGKDPIGTVEDDYTARVGRETAVWAMNEELKHYTTIALINTGVGDIEGLRERTRENAEFFKKQYREVEGSSRFFRRILYGPYDEKEFIFLAAGETLQQDPFFD